MNYKILIVVLVLIVATFASSNIFNNLNTIHGFSRQNRVFLQPSHDLF